MKELIKNLFEYLIYFGILVSILSGIGKFIKRHLMGGKEVARSPSFPESKDITTTSNPHQAEETTLEEIDHTSLERDVRLSSLSKEEISRPQYRSRKSSSLTPSFSKPILSTKSSSDRLYHLQKELHQPESLQKAFLLSEILKPKHNLQ